MPDPTPTPESPSTDDPPETPAATPDPAASADDPDLFPRSYVEELRAEAAEQRTKAKRADIAAERLVTMYAASTQRLADPTDLPYHDDLLGDDGLPDAAKVTAAVDALLVAKPHLASRKPQGDIGQGARPEEDQPSLAALLRAGAG